MIINLVNKDLSYRLMIIDFHTHLFPDTIRQNRENYFTGEPGFELLYKSLQSKMIGGDDLITSMDEHNVDISIVFGFPWKNPETIRQHNDYIIEMVNRFKGRLIGLCCFDGLFKDAVEETTRCIDNGLSGVGELAFYDSEINNLYLDNLKPVMEICRKKDLPVLIHANEPVGHKYPGKAPNSLAGVYQFIKRFSNNTIVLAHWGGGLFFYRLLKKEVQENLVNVYFDTAASPFLYETSIYAVAKELIGVDKILLGTDYPLIKPSRYFNELENSGLLQGDIEKICGLNAATLLKKSNIMQ